MRLNAPQTEVFHRIISGSKGGGGKSGGSSAHTPVEAPNTLRSRAIARLIDVVGEGEVEGLIDGLKSVYLDDTPLQNEDGSFNFTNVSVEFRAGTPDQEPLGGFVAVEAEQAVGVEITNASAVVRAVNDLTATSVRVKIRLNALLEADQSTGDINPTSVQVAIDVQASGGDFVTAINDTISGKTSSQYQRAYRVSLTGSGPWNIRTRRLTPDNASSTLQNQTFFDSFTIIEDYQLRYNDTALFGITADAESFGGRIPSRKYLGRWLKIKVPSNYDPLTREYTGIWDGTFKVAWTDNPAWVFYACVDNTRWGVGEFIPAALRDKWTLYTIAKYCDELVPDGFGGQEPRYTFNGVIADAEEAIKVLTMIASVFRGLVFWGPSGVTAIADMPGDAAKLVVPGNVIGGIIDWSGASLKARHTACYVTWYDPDNLYQRNIEVVEGDPDDIRRFGWRVLEIVAYGCTVRGQAHRTGRWAIESEKSESEACKWKAAWDHAQVYPGQIVEVNDPAYSGLEFGGRIVGLVTNGLGDVIGVEVDRPIEIESGKTYSLKVALIDGSISERPITTGAITTSILNFDIPFNPVPIIGAVWSLTSSSISPRAVRVLARVEEDGGLFEFTGVLHDPTKFARIEQNLTLEQASFTALPTGPLAAPTNIVVQENLTLVGGGLVRNKITVSWTPTNNGRVTGYEVQTKPPGENWQHAGTTSSVSIDILDLTIGVWGFRVRAFDAIGRVSPWLTTETKELDGLLLPPDDITNLRTTFVSNNLALSWDEISDYRPHKYEIRQGTTFESALRLYDVAHPPFLVFGEGKYWVAAYIGPDAGPRIYADSPSNIDISNPLLTRNVIVMHDESGEGWSGTFTGWAGRDSANIRTGGQADLLSEDDFLSVVDVLNAGGQGNGAYYSPHIVDIGRAAPCLVGVTWNGTGVPTGQDILTIQDFLATPDVLGGLSTQFVDVYPIIRVSQTGAGDVFGSGDVFGEPDVFYSAADWGAWTKFAPGEYTGQLFQMGMELRTTNDQVIAYGLAMNWFIDPPDRRDEVTNITVPAVGFPITFTPKNDINPAPFNGGPNDEALPHVQATIVDAQSGDEVVIKDLSKAGCTAFVRNSGIFIERAGVNLSIAGY
jgi:predicted phage tail protein